MSTQLDMIDPTTDSFNEGYQTGLTWNADWVPGGPQVYTPSPRYQNSAEHQRKHEASKEHARLWMAGWKHGMTIDPNKLITKHLGTNKTVRRSVEVFPWSA